MIVCYILNKTTRYNAAIYSTESIFVGRFREKSFTLNYDKIEVEIYLEHPRGALIKGIKPQGKSWILKIDPRIEALNHRSR